MAIDKLSFGLGAGYDPPFAVDEVDVNRIKLRSKETAPLTHNTLDENFANLSLKINALIDTGIDSITIADTKVAAANLNISNGTGITYVDGVFAHQAKPAVGAGYTETSGNISNKIITGINVDSMGHFVGFESNTGAMSATFSSVGIGIPTPVVALHAVGPNDPNFDRISNICSEGTDAYNSGNAGGGIHFTGKYDSSGNVTTFAQISGIKENTTDDDYKGALTFGTRDGSTTNMERMRIDSDGNVGIGTTSPQRNLDIYDTGGACANRIWAISDSALGDVSMLGAWTEYGVKITPGADGSYYTSDDAPDFNYTVGIDSTDADAGSSNIDFPKFKFGYSHQKWSAPGASDKTIMTLQPDGNVGLGTTSPDFLLDLEQKDGGVQLQLGRTNTAAGSAWMGADSTGFHLGVGAYGAENSVVKPNGFTVGADGNVGIGTTSPKQALQVEGGNIQCNQQIRATGWFTGDVPSAGPATEIGYSSGTGWVMAYDRVNSVYSKLTLQAGSVTLRLNPTSGILEHSIDGGNNYSNLAHDSRSVAANDWIVGYGSTDHKRLSYNSAKKECVLSGGLVPGRHQGNSTDDTIGCFYKAKRIEPTVSKYRITIRARSSVAKPSGFYIGVVYADSDTISDSAGLNTHVVNSQDIENEEPPQDTFDGVAPDTTEAFWMKSDGNIEDSWGTYTYEISPPAGKKWFSVLLLNWENMGNADLFFDPLIDVEPINPTFEYDSATGTLNIVNP